MMNTAKNLDFEEEKTKITSVTEKSKSRKCITTMEKYLSLPKEVRDKAKIDMKYFWDNSETLIPKALKETVIEQLESGFPVSYGDGNGHVLTRYPDGKIFLSKVDMKTYEITETFLRMATPEDDSEIYD